MMIIRMCLKIWCEFDKISWVWFFVFRRKLCHNSILQIMTINQSLLSHFLISLLTVPHWKNSVVFPYPLTNSLVWIQRVWYESEFQTNSVVWECGTGKKSIFIKNNEKICDKNLSIKKSLGYSYTVFILKESKSFLYWRYWQFVISKLLLLKGSWIKQKTQSTLTNYSGWK